MPRHGASRTSQASRPLLKLYFDDPNLHRFSLGFDEECPSPGDPNLIPNSETQADERDIARH